jgi:NADH-quinone oxidoreductase subunit K
MVPVSYYLVLSALMFVIGCVGQLAVFFVMVVAAAEAAVGLAIILSMFRSMKSVETTDSAELNG